MKVFFGLIFLFFSCITNAQLSKTNWLKTGEYPSYVELGDIDVIGKTITVEANFYCTQKSSNGSWGHLISKHTGANNLNYAVSPNGVEIATKKSGYKYVNIPCEIELNVNYHIALVYNGEDLKLYRNGILLGKTPCKGDLITNNLEATIAQVSNAETSGEQFIGFVNEVRIWNVERSQQDIYNYMNKSLPNFTTQKGLLAYYIFDNLKNKTNINEFNGTITGNVKSNQVLNSFSFPASKKVTLKPNGKTILCTNEFVQLEIEGGNRSDFQWLKNGEVMDGEKRKIRKMTDAGIYNVRINDEVCPLVSNSILVEVFEYPKKDLLVSNTEIKNDTPVLIKALANDVQYLWNNNSTNQSITIMQAGKYAAVLNNNGCITKTDTISITQKIQSKFNEYTKRKNEVFKSFIVNDTSTITLNFYDYRQLDGDSISVYVNGVKVLYNQLLSKKPLPVKVKFSKLEPIVEVIVVAENLGTIPPNTAMMTAVINGKKTELQIVSSDQKNAVLNFKLKK